MVNTFHKSRFIAFKLSLTSVVSFALGYLSILYFLTGLQHTDLITTDNIV